MFDADLIASLEENHHGTTHNAVNLRYCTIPFYDTEWLV